MKKFLIWGFLLFPIVLTAQQSNFNIEDGFVAEGYDVVSYFEGKPEKGKAELAFTYQGANFLFSTSRHLDLFKTDPEKYSPLYGGWCAYAMAKTGEKVSVNPKTYEIRNDRLLLFYDAFFTNTFKKWKSEGPEQLKQKADQNWLSFQQKAD